LEALLAADPRTGAFCHGNRPGLAEVALVPQVVNAERYKLDMTPYPTIARIFGSCMKLAPFQAAHPDNQADREP
jgi:glutathione S-transferase